MNADENRGVSEATLRARIVAVAREWIGTPYHHHARVKGQGADCIGFVSAVYEESGALAKVEMPEYSPQHFVHSAEEKLINHILKHGARQCIAPEPGDMIVFKLARAFAHCGIVVEWPREIIHAHHASRRVLAQPPFETDMKGRDFKFFTLF